MIMIFVAITLLLVAFAGAVTGQACCSPDQWQGELGSATGYSGPNPRFVANQMQIFYDATNSRLAAKATVYGYDKPKHYLIVNRDDEKCVFTKQDKRQKEDGCGKGKMYVLDLDTNKCFIQSRPFQKACIPDEAKFMGKLTFGAGNDTLVGQSFGLDKSEGKGTSMSAWITVTVQDCIPVGVSSHGSIKGVGFMGTYGYSNIKLSIDDPSVFDVPAQCQKNASTTALPQDVEDIHFFF